MEFRCCRPGASTRNQPSCSQAHECSAVVRELATRYSDRLIILDGPPLLATSEAEALASQVGQIVLVVEAGRTSHEELRQTLEMLSPNKAVNVVLNKVQHWGQFGDFSGEYGYHSYRDS